MSAAGPTLADERRQRYEGRARSALAAVRLARFERRMQLPITLGALLPIVVAFSRAAPDSAVSIVVNIVAWLIFVFDLVVHMWLVRGYVRTRYGVFDLAVVVITAPWFLISGFGNSQILSVARLARLVRVL